MANGDDLGFVAIAKADDLGFAPVARRQAPLRRQGATQPLTQQDVDAFSAPTQFEKAHPQIKPYYGFTPGNILGQAKRGIGELGSGIYEMGKDVLFPEGQTEGDKLRYLGKKYIFDPADRETELARRGGQTTAESIGHSIASALPLVGPWAAGLGEQAGAGDPGGALGRGSAQVAAGLVAKPILGEAAKRTAPARRALAENVVAPLVYENVGETGADVRTGITPEKAITREGLVGTKKGLVEKSAARVKELKQAADNILQNHPNARQVINAEPLIDQAIDNAIKETEKIAGSTERLESLRTALKTKYGDVQGTPYQINNLKTEIQKAANGLGAYKNTQPVEASLAGAMKDAANRIRNAVNQAVPEAADLNQRMADSIDAQAGLTRNINASRGRSIFGGFHEGTTSTLLNRTLGSAPVRSLAARGLMAGLTEGIPAPSSATPFAAPGPFRVPLGNSKAPPNAAGAIEFTGTEGNEFVLGRKGTGGVVVPQIGGIRGLLPAPENPFGLLGKPPEQLPQYWVDPSGTSVTGIPERTVQRGLGGRMQRVYLGTSKPRIVGYTADGGPIYEGEILGRK